VDADTTHRLLIDSGTQVSHIEVYVCEACWSVVPLADQEAHVGWHERLPVDYSSVPF
jgi:hypothetical protein